MDIRAKQGRQTSTPVRQLEEHVHPQPALPGSPRGAVLAREGKEAMPRPSPGSETRPVASLPVTRVLSQGINGLNQGLANLERCLAPEDDSDLSGK